MAMLISQGLVGPKGIPNGGPDGQMVNIPSPLHTAKEGRRAVLQATYRIVVHAMRKVLRQIRAPLIPSRVESERACPIAICRSALPRKASKHKYVETVPQTNTGGKVEKTKTNE